MATVPVCPDVVVGRYGSTRWPCVRAVGHDGDCMAEPASRHYAVPPSLQSKEWLASEVGLLLVRIESMERQARETFERQRSDDARRNGVLQNALTHGNGRRNISSAKHDETCWLRHTACLARRALGWEE
jgi:hypothetical protein